MNSFISHDPNVGKPKIGLALGSGLVRGWAHIGVIRALEQAGTLRDGSRPLAVYLRAAAALSGERREAQVFRDALRALGES